MSIICALLDADPLRAGEIRPILSELSRRGENVVAGLPNGIHPDCLLFDAASAAGRAAEAAMNVPSIACHLRPAAPDQSPAQRLNLVLIAKELQPNIEQFDSSYRWVGRCIAPPEAGPIDVGHDPVVYISPVLEACREAFDGTLYQVVTAHPSPDLLRWAVLAIAEASPRTIDACFREDVPMLVSARDPSEAALADRVVELGAGLRLEEADVTAGRTRELALRVVNEPAFSEGARSAGSAVRSAGGTSLACDEIQAFLKL